jgi:hypothetical protein
MGGDIHDRNTLLFELRIDEPRRYGNRFDGSRWPQRIFGEEHGDESPIGRIDGVLQVPAQLGQLGDRAPFAAVRIELKLLRLCRVRKKGERLTIG